MEAPLLQPLLEARFGGVHVLNLEPLPRRDGRVLFSGVWFRLFDFWLRAYVFIGFGFWLGPVCEYMVDGWRKNCEA